MEKVFEALASTPRRKILAYLSETDLTAGEIASRFEMSKPAISKHLQILEDAGLILVTKYAPDVPTLRVLAVAPGMTLLPCCH